MNSKLTNSENNVQSIISMLKHFTIDEINQLCDLFSACKTEKDQQNLLELLISPSFEHNNNNSLSPLLTNSNKIENGKEEIGN